MTAFHSYKVNRRAANNLGIMAPVGEIKSLPVILQDQLLVQQ